MNKIVLLSPRSDDWEALYVNGKLVAERHSLSVRDVFDAIANIFPNEFKYKEISDEKAEEGFSKNLTDMEEFIIEG